MCHYAWVSNTLKKVKSSKIGFGNVFYPIQHIKGIVISVYNHYKIIEMFPFFMVKLQGPGCILCLTALQTNHVLSAQKPHVTSMAKRGKQI